MCDVCGWCVVCGVCWVCVCGVCWVRVNCWVCVVCVVQNWAFTLIKCWLQVYGHGFNPFFSVRAIIKHMQFHVVASLVQMADLKLEHHRADISVNLSRFQVYRQLFNIFDCSPRNA